MERLNSYNPKVGDSVHAERKVGNDYPKQVVGPVVKVDDDFCYIENNVGTIMQRTFRLSLKDYNFRFLHLSKEADNE